MWRRGREKINSATRRSCSRRRQVRSPLAKRVSDPIHPVALSPVETAVEELVTADYPDTAARAADLIGVVVRMDAVNAQPVLNRVAAALAVRTGPPPLLLAETAQDRRRRRPCRLERGQGWCDRAVGVEVADERLLVVPEEGRRVLRDQ